MVTNAQELKQEFQARAKACSLNVQVLGGGNFAAEIAVVGEFPGERECYHKENFVGGSGQHLWNELRKHGITRQHVYTTNVIKRQLPNVDGKREAISRNELAHWEGLLDWELNCLPNLRYILVLGNAALEAVTGRQGITNWRGSVVTCNGRTCVITFNPAHVLREAKWEVIFAFDIGKLKRVLDGKYNEYKIETIINPSYKEACDTITRCHDEGIAGLPVSFDIEVISGETACIGLANNDHRGTCISFRDRTRNTYSTSEELDLRRRFQTLFADDRIKLVAQNGTFDSYWLYYKDRIQVRRIWFDTLLAHHTLYPTLPHNLGFLTAQYTEHPYYKDEKSGWKEGGDIDTFWQYNIKDCCITRKSQGRLLQELQQQKLDEFFFNHVMRLQPHLVGMTVLGIRVDESLKEVISEQLQGDVEKLKRRFWEAVHEATGDSSYCPSPTSPKQLGQLFFTHLRLVGRGFSTDADNRKRMLAHPRTSLEARRVLTSLNDFAEENKFLTTYAEMGVDEDGRARCEYKQYGTQSAPGRLSSTKVMWGSGMNFQNQPDRAKCMFVADDGTKFIYFDLSQAEARIVAEIWNVTGLLENFALARDKGIDVHRANAARIFRVHIDDIPKEDRFPDGTVTKRFLGKRCVHGLNYRMGPQKLADVCGIPLHQAEDAYRSYHQAFPEIRQGWDNTIKEVYRTKQLYTPLGRRLKFLGRLPSLGAQDGTDEASTLDSIIAFVPQSTVGDFVSSCIYRIHDDPEWPQQDARVVLNVHDALIAQVPDSRDVVEHCARVMKRHAEAPIYIRGRPLCIPADFAASTKTIWMMEERDGMQELVFKDGDDGLHRWSSLRKFKLAA